MDDKAIRFPWEARMIDTVIDLWRRVDSHYLALAAMMTGSPHPPRRQIDKTFLRWWPVMFAIISALLIGDWWVATTVTKLKDDIDSRTTDQQRQIDQNRMDIQQNKKQIDSIQQDMQNYIYRHRNGDLSNLPHE